MAKIKTATEVFPQILERYGSSLMAGDPEQWIKNWTEDCVQMPPGGPMNYGKPVLYESISAWLDAYDVSEFKIWDLEIQEMGDWAYSQLNYSYFLAPIDGSPSYLFEGKALTIYKRNPDGTWKTHLDCFNSNTPDH